MRGPPFDHIFIPTWSEGPWSESQSDYHINLGGYFLTNQRPESSPVADEEAWERRAKKVAQSAFHEKEAAKEAVLKIDREYHRIKFNENDV